MTTTEYYILPWYKKLGVKTYSAAKNIAGGLAGFFRGIPKAAAGFFRAIGNGFKNYGTTFAKGGALTKLSYVMMGAGNLFRGQIIKGLLFLIAEAAYICQIILINIIGLFYKP